MKRRIFLSALLVLAGLLSFYLRSDAEQTREGFAMNTIIRITIYSKNNDALNDAYELLAKLDNQLSMYNPSSDISRINSLAGREKYSAPPEVIEVVNDAKKLYDITGGVFNPLIGAVTRLWKINRADNTIPSPESLDAALSLSDMGNLEIDDSNIYLTRPGCVLDLGGIAKGYASRKISDMLKVHGVKSGIIDLGGNVQVVGTKEDGSKWRIGVRDPLQPYGVPALVLDVDDCAVITSGNYERYKVVDGRKYSHFFDAKTGKSIMSDLLSVTLVTPDGSLADGLATAFMISGYSEAVNVLKKLSPMPGAIFIRQKDDGSEEILASENLRNVITHSKNDVTYF